MRMCKTQIWLRMKSNLGIVRGTGPSRIYGAFAERNVNRGLCVPHSKLKCHEFRGSSTSTSSLISEAELRTVLSSPSFPPPSLPPILWSTTVGQGCRVMPEAFDWTVDATRWSPAQWQEWWVVYWPMIVRMAQTGLYWQGMPHGFLKLSSVDTV